MCTLTTLIHDLPSGGESWDRVRFMGKQNSGAYFCKHLAAAPVYGKRCFLGARLPALSLLSLACANPVAWPAWVAGTPRGRLEKARLPHVPH